MSPAVPILPINTPSSLVETTSAWRSQQKGRNCEKVIMGRHRLTVAEVQRRRNFCAMTLLLMILIFCPRLSRRVVASEGHYRLKISIAHCFLSTRVCQFPQYKLFLWLLEGGGDNTNREVRYTCTYLSVCTEESMSRHYPR